MSKNSDLIKSAVMLVGFILGFVSIFLAIQRIDKYLRIKAIDECAKISRFEKQDSEQSAKIYYPLPEVYNKCIKLKGY